MRTALTTEMWDAINGAWLELRNYAGKDLNRDEFGRFLDWVKTVSLTFDGSAFRTMLRNDAFWFTRLGTAIERADNTARILDVKYQILLPHDETVGGSSTTSSGPRSCAKSRRSMPITGCIARASSRCWWPTC